MRRFKTNKGMLIEEHVFGAESPRSFYDNFSKFYTFIPRYCSPDAHGHRDMKSWLKEFLSPKMYEELDEAFEECGATKDNLLKLIEYAKKRGFVLFPVNKTGDDYVLLDEVTGSGFVGVIFMSKEDIYKIWSKRISPALLEKIKEDLREQVRDYSCWANDEVFSYYFEGEKDDFIESFGAIDDYPHIKDSLGVTEFSQYLVD